MEARDPTEEDRYRRESGDCGWRNRDSCKIIHMSICMHARTHIHSPKRMHKLEMIKLILRES